MGDSDARLGKETAVISCVTAMPLLRGSEEVFSAPRALFLGPLILGPFVTSKFSPYSAFPDRLDGSPELSSAFSPSLALAAVRRAWALLAIGVTDANMEGALVLTIFSETLFDLGRPSSAPRAL